MVAWPAVPALVCQQADARVQVLLRPGQHLAPAACACQQPAGAAVCCLHPLLQSVLACSGRGALPGPLWLLLRLQSLLHWSGALQRPSTSGSAGCQPPKVRWRSDMHVSLYCSAEPPHLLPDNSRMYHVARKLASTALRCCVLTCKGAKRHGQAVAAEG